jgi:hypothetical protein
MSNELKNGQNKAKDFLLDKKDLEDFRVPIDIFKEYSHIMKNLNKECQNYFLAAMGVDISYSKAKISWELYINLNALLRFNTASFLEYVNFFVKVMDPYQSKIVPKA